MSFLHLWNCRCILKTPAIHARKEKRVTKHSQRSRKMHKYIARNDHIVADVGIVYKKSHWACMRLSVLAVWNVGQWTRLLFSLPQCVCERKVCQTFPLSVSLSLNPWLSSMFSMLWAKTHLVILHPRHTPKYDNFLCFPAWSHFQKHRFIKNHTNIATSINDPVTLSTFDRDMITNEIPKSKID